MLTQIIITIGTQKIMQEKKVLVIARSTNSICKFLFSGSACNIHTSVERIQSRHGVIGEMHDGLTFFKHYQIIW